LHEIVPLENVEIVFYIDLFMETSQNLIIRILYRCVYGHTPKVRRTFTYMNEIYIRSYS